MSKQQAWTLIVIAAVAVGALVQMNRYEYLVRNLGGWDTYLIRIDHLTGHQCVASLPPGLHSKSKRQKLLKLLNMTIC